jgi:hypothetical protein
VVTVLQKDPTVSASSIRRESKKETHIPFEYKRSVEYLVRNAKKQVVARELSCVRLDGTTASFSTIEGTFMFENCHRKVSACFSYLFMF